MNINTTIISGNLVRDPELRHTQSGKEVSTVTIANNHKYGEKEVTTFVDVTVWGKVAENVCKYKKKGDEIVAQGRLEQQSWEKDGEKRSKISLQASNVQWPYSASRDSLGGSSNSRDDFGSGVGGDDVPF